MPDRCEGRAPGAQHRRPPLHTMKKNRNKAYVFGKRFKFGLINLPYSLEESFKLPANAAILDGISAVFISGYPLALPLVPIFDVLINNEILIEGNELAHFCIVKGHTPAVFATANISTDADPYHPTPRPLSGSDEVRVRFQPGTWDQTKDVYIYLHFHYQPKA